MNVSDIDPQMAVILEAMLKRMASRPPMTAITPEEMRARASSDFIYWNEDPPSLSRVTDTNIAGAFGPVNIRIYDPLDNDEPMPTLIYFHGGGWIIGDLDMEDCSLRLLAQRSGIQIVSVDYCLAPEHRFPAPLHDCIAVCRSVFNSGSELGINTAQLAVGGASAGANLALATALSLRDTGEDWLKYLLLFYGVYSANTETESHRLYGGGDYGLDTAAMKYFFSLYLGPDANKEEPLFAPLNADLSGLPPAFVNVAGLDPLRDDSRALAIKLRQAGVDVEEIEYPGTLHGFTLMARDLAVADKALSDAAVALKNIFKK